MSVAKRFEQLLENLSLTALQVDNGFRARQSVVRVLNAHYYSQASDTANSIFIGSWAKGTRIRPPRDVDVQYFLPTAVRVRFDQRAGNQQSQLLQEVRGVLLRHFTQTAIKGDGPTVLVPLTAFLVELVPSFARYPSGSDVCITSGAGSYKKEDYAAQLVDIQKSDDQTAGCTRDLIRIMKCWQRECSVPLRSFLIENSVIAFLSTWGSVGKGKIYYDWMVRDYLSYLIRSQNTFVYASGTYEPLYLGNSWLSKAEMALARARKACEFEAQDLTVAAGEEWQKIFGSYIPKYV